VALPDSLAGLRENVEVGREGMEGKGGRRRRVKVCTPIAYAAE